MVKIVEEEEEDFCGSHEEDDKPIEWLRMLYPWGEGRLVIQGSAMRSKSREWEHKVLKPGSKGWTAVTDIVSKVIESGPAIHVIKSIQRLESSTVPDDAVVQAGREGLELLVRLAFDGLRRQSTGDRDDNFYQELSERWLKTRERT